MISARRQKLTRASCRRRAGTVEPRAEHFSDFITADHKVLSESESRNASICRDGTAMQWIPIPVQIKNFLGDPEEPNEVLGADKETKKSFTLTIPWNFGKSCEELSRNHCTSTPHRSETNGIAERQCAE